MLLVIWLALTAGLLIAVASGWVASRLVARHRATAPAPSTLATSARYAIWHEGAVWTSAPSWQEGVLARQQWERTPSPATFYDGGTRRDRK